MKDDISPEERLLRLIKGQKLEEPKASLSLKSGVLPSDGSTLKSALFSPRLPLRKYLSATYADKLVSALLILAALLVIISFAYPFIFLRHIRIPKIEAQKGQLEKANASGIKNTLDYYLQGARGKNIFAVKNSSTSNSAAMSGAEVQSIKDINVVGIIMGANPQAILEDKKNMKSYYVSKGQFVGEFLVEDIQEGKIIVNFKGQKVELYL